MSVMFNLKCLIDSIFGQWLHIHDGTENIHSVEICVHILLFYLQSYIL